MSQVIEQSLVSEFDGIEQQVLQEENIPIKTNENRCYYYAYILFLNVVAICVILLQMYLYHSQQYECPYQYESQCESEFLVNSIKYSVVKDLISVALYLFLLYLVIKKRMFIIYFIIITTWQCYVLLFCGHQFNVRNYQVLIQIIYALIIIAALSILGVSITILKLWNRFRFRFLAIFIVLFCSFVGLIYFKYSTSCQYWMNGLNGQKIINDNISCTIPKPLACEYDIFDGLFNLNHFKPQCSNQDDVFSQSEYLNYLLLNNVNITNNTKYLEYPRTEYIDHSLRYLQFDQFQLEVLKQINPIDSLDELSPNTEVYYDLEKQQFFIQIKRNESLVQERTQKFLNFETYYQRPKNIIMLWVDAVSRARFIKELPKSTQILTKMSNNDDLYLFQAFKYISVGVFSYPAYLAYEYGIANIDDHSNTFENWTMNHHETISLNGQKKSIQEHMISNGYIVGKAFEQCLGQLTEVMEQNERFYKASPSDHELISLSCDINWQDPREAYGIYQGPYSIFRRCFHQRDQYEYIFDYGKQFLRTYKDEPKYLELYFLEGHEGTVEVVKELDNPLSEFLQFLSDEGYDKDSIIFLGSDHGMHMQGTSYLLQYSIRDIELSLPGMFLLIDNNLLTQEDQEILTQNAQQAVWVKDLNQLLRYYTTTNDQNRKYFKSNSMLSSVVPQNRSCSNIPKPTNQYCPCK